MDELECIPELDIVSSQLSEIHTAINAGDYSTLQRLLLNQSIVLHKIGMDFIGRSNEATKLQLKAVYMDIALRSLAQSQRTMATIKLMKADKPA